MAPVPALRAVARIVDLVALDDGALARHHPLATHGCVVVDADIPEAALEDVVLVTTEWVITLETILRRAIVA